MTTKKKQTRKTRRNWISHKIKILISEGYPQKQAVAIAENMWKSRNRRKIHNSRKKRRK